MRIELVSIKTPAEPLDGLFYMPEDGKPHAAALLMHGNCHNFYSGPSRFLPEVLTARGVACLTFNRRGHDMVTSLAGRAVGGGAFQLAAESIEDNRLAADFLAARGFRAPIIIGHSNGGMLAAKHCADNYGNPRALVMMSAHCGGENIMRFNCESGLYAGDKLEELTTLAREMVGQGRGRELIQLPGWWYVTSGEALLDRRYNTPDIIECAPLIKCPSLFLRGAKEEQRCYPAEDFAAHAGGKCEVNILPDCDHSYTGHEHGTALLIGEWLDKTCGF